MHLSRTLLTVLIALFLLVMSMDANALRCGRHIIKQGDLIHKIARYCPEPFWVDRWSQSAVADGVYGRGYDVIDQLESWYLNLGSRKLMRRLVFRNGYLESEDTLDYGFNEIPNSSRCSGHDLESAGETLAEVYAHCGPPDFQYSYPISGYPHHRGPNGHYSGPRLTTLHHVWTYLSPRGRGRVLHFEDGRLLSIENAD